MPVLGHTRGVTVGSKSDDLTISVLTVANDLTRRYATVRPREYFDSGAMYIIGHAIAGDYFRPGSGRVTYLSII